MLGCYTQLLVQEFRKSYVDTGICIQPQPSEKQNFVEQEKLKSSVLEFIENVNIHSSLLVSQ